MSKETFKDAISKYNLSVNDFLNLRDEWNTLSFSDREDLIMEEEKKKNNESINQGCHCISRNQRRMHA